MKHNAHFSLEINEKLKKQDKKWNQDFFNKEMVCGAKLSDHKCSEVWSVLQYVIEQVETRLLVEEIIESKEVAPV